MFAIRNDDNISLEEEFNASARANGIEYEFNLNEAC